MRRTLRGGPWRTWLVLAAVLLVFGTAGVIFNAPAQDDGLEDILDDDTGDDTGDDIGGLGDDDDGGEAIDGEAIDDEAIDGEGDDTDDEGFAALDTGEEKKDRDTSTEQRQKFIYMLNQGGPLMYVLLAIEIVVVALIIESGFNVNSLKVLPVELVETIEEDFEKNDVDAVVQKCEENPGMLANVLHAGLTAPSASDADVKEAIELAGEHEGESFMTHVGYLSTFAVISPMVGLLGTVTGMIIAFREVAQSGGLGKPEQLAGGINQALLTTAFGLIIGIPAMFMYYYFKNRGLKILMVVENSVKRFMKWRTQPDNRGVPRGGIVPQRLVLLVDEALSNAFVGVMPVVGFILGPFAISKAIKIKAELREVGGNPTSAALTAEPWKATMALVLGAIDIVIWPLVLVLYIILG
ncbi:MAG: MotA/TolQ/ExbB proton channel family protein [Verrucomicrobia bacterium]|nr:MotA/TolQ/ExbB proton channel family protein [Verrucomicrobiota bacterium]